MHKFRIQSIPIPPGYPSGKRNRPKHLRWEREDGKGGGEAEEGWRRLYIARRGLKRLRETEIDLRRLENAFLAFSAYVSTQRKLGMRGEYGLGGKRLAKARKGFASLRLAKAFLAFEAR